MIDCKTFNSFFLQHNYILLSGAGRRVQKHDKSAQGSTDTG